MKHPVSLTSNGNSALFRWFNEIKQNFSQETRFTLIRIGPHPNNNIDFTDEIDRVSRPLARLGHGFHYIVDEEADRMFLSSLSLDLPANNTNFYIILGVRPSASMTQIRAAYRYLTHRHHPDRSSHPKAAQLFAKIHEAYETLRDSFKRLAYDRSRYYGYKYNPNEQSSLTLTSPTPKLLLKPKLNAMNECTFLNHVPVNDIYEEHLLMLDGYAFDVNELVALAESDLQSLYKNPHVIDKTQNQDFSAAAKKRLANHPLLQPYAVKLEKLLWEQKTGIKSATINALIVMLNEFDTHSVEGSHQARAKFLEHKATLTADEAKKLDEFIIMLPTQGGGFNPMHFEQAFVGGHAECLATAKMFLWHFVVTIRPAAFSLVPQAVLEMATRNWYVIQPPSAENRAQQHPATVEPRLRTFGLFGGNNTPEDTFTAAEVLASALFNPRRTLTTDAERRVARQAQNLAEQSAPEAPRSPSNR